MKFSKVLITGCHGQLGGDLVRVISDKYTVTGIDIQDLDLRDAPKTTKYINRIAPSIIIHTAAYTDVDGCEKT